MQVRCPHCDTLFRLPREVAAAAERVRCGCCGKPFATALHRVPLTLRRVPEEVPTDTAVAPDALPTPPDAPTTPDNAEILALSGDLDEVPAARPRRGPAARIATLTGVLLLLGLFAAQLFFGLREPLLASPEYRPWLERGCRWAGCELPPLRDPDRVEILARDIRSHPRYRNGLLVDLTLVNRATFSQPFPLLQLTFTSLDERWFAQRRFHPDEYLGANRGSADRLPPDIPVQVVLELLDPGPEAVNFTFSFL